MPYIAKYSEWKQNSRQWINKNIKQKKNLIKIFTPTFFLYKNSTSLQYKSNTNRKPLSPRTGERRALINIKARWYKSKNKIVVLHRNNWFNSCSKQRCSFVRSFFYFLKHSHAKRTFLWLLLLLLCSMVW